MKLKDLTGKRFGRLVVLGENGRSVCGSIMWECHCDCGNKVAVRGNNLKCGHTKSCGCLSRETAARLIKKRATKHGKINTPEYKTWKRIRTRCYNKKSLDYRNYGGRGIKMCKRWSDFRTFYSDMGKKPTSGHSIERVDNNKGYSPNNCVWATRIEQQRNKRVPVVSKTGTAGVSFHKQAGKYQARIGVDGKRISLGYFSDLSEAVAARIEAEEEYWGKAYQQ